jgi:hypothetical protein
VTKACCRCHFKNAAEQESMKNIPIKAAWVSLVASSFVAILLTFALFSANAAESGNEQESKTEELAKETQNPVANLISVPFQNNFNFGIGPNDATQWVLNVQPVNSDHLEQRLEPDHTDYHTHHQPAVSSSRDTERVRTGRHQPQPVSLAGEFWQTDLGCWADDDIPNGYRLTAGQWEVERGARLGPARHAGPLGVRGTGEQPMVVCGVGQK